MVLPWAAKVERQGKQIMGDEAEEAHWNSLGYQTNNFRMEDRCGTSGEAGMVHLQVVLPR
jgi:hypothetical protein